MTEDEDELRRHRTGWPVPQMPIPRCLHGNPWHSCPSCGDQRRRDPAPAAVLDSAADHAP